MSSVDFSESPLDKETHPVPAPVGVTVFVLYVSAVTFIRQAPSFAALLKLTVYSFSLAPPASTTVKVAAPGREETVNTAPSLIEEVPTFNVGATVIASYEGLYGNSIL